jgi:hypothetical protein
MMLRFYWRISLFIFLSGLLIFSCSQLGLQPKKETAELPPMSDCKKNYTKEGNFISGRVYKTWVKYDNLDFKKAFNAAVKSIRTSGNRIISTDQESGTICAEIAFGAEQTFYPVNIKFVKEKSSLIIHLDSKATSGTKGPDILCNFYEEFEKLIKQPPPPPQPKPTTKPPSKLSPEPVSKPPPKPSPETVSKPPSPPPLPPETPAPQGHVIWAYVNLREGPGTKYKVVGNIKKGTTFTILEDKGGWLHIRLEEGKEAWVAKSATSLVHQISPSPSPKPAPPKLKSPM